MWYQVEYVDRSLVYAAEGSLTSTRLWMWCTILCYERWILYENMMDFGLKWMDFAQGRWPQTAMLSRRKRTNVSTQAISTINLIFFELRWICPPLFQWKIVHTSSICQYRVAFCSIYRLGGNCLWMHFHLKCIVWNAFIFQDSVCQTLATGASRRRISRRRCDFLLIRCGSIFVDFDWQFGSVKSCSSARRSSSAVCFLCYFVLFLHCFLLLFCCLLC